MPETQNSASSAQSPSGGYRTALVDGLLCVGIVAAYPHVLQWLKSVTQLPESSYHTALLLDDLCQRLLTQKRILVPCMVALIVFRRRIPWRWPTGSYWTAVRAVIICGAGTLTLSASFYGYNFWYGQSHGTDRMVLIGLCLMSLRYPMLLAPWLLLVYVIHGQFDYPVGAMNETHKLLPLNAIGVFLLALVTAALIRCPARSGRLLLTLLLVTFASHYWFPAVEKIGLKWTESPNRHHLVLGAFESGWMWWLSPASLDSFCGLLAPADYQVTLITLVAELGVILAFLSPRLRSLALAVTILLHLGIFALSGILFWEWIVFDLALLFSCRALPSTPLPHAFFGIAAVATMSASTGAPGLAWLDSPLTHVFRITETTADGGQTALSPSEFRPYELLFAQQRFGYVSTYPEVTGTMGAMFRHQTLTQINRVTTPQELEQLLATNGRVEQDTDRAALLRELVAKSRLAAVAPRTFWHLRLIPDHIWQIHGVPEACPKAPQSHATLWEQTVLHTLDRRIVLPAVPVTELKIGEDE